MSFDARKKKSWSSKSGVSEIIGNILILMITVVLFSSIMAFVQNMPMPEQLTKATFSAGITFSGTGTSADLTVTHAGGDTMKTSQTMVLVEKDSTASGYNLTTYPLPNSAPVWKTGMTWTKHLNGTTYSSVIIVTVVDMAKKASVWTSQVTGGSGHNPPVIGQRYTDADPATPTPDPVLEWDDFTFYASITDPDNNLNTAKVWIDSRQLEGSGSIYAKRAPVDPTVNPFSWTFSGIRSRGLSAQDLDGGIILIHAEDTEGHATESTFVMKITKLPLQNVTIPPSPENTTDQGTGDSGFPGYIDNRFDNLGWVILGEKKVNGVGTGIANTTDKRTTFIKDERVFIRVASTTGSNNALTNLMSQDAMTVQDERTAMMYSPNYTGGSNTVPVKPFYSIPYSGNAYVYECQFNTQGIPPGRYSLHMMLKNTPGLGKPQVSFDQIAAIDITQAGNTIDFVPVVTLSKLSNFTGNWGGKTTPFAVSSSDLYKVYVTILVRDSVYPPSPSCTEIRIVDMTGSAELFGVPPSGKMISKIMSRPDGQHYNFTIDLRMNNGAQWRSGTNSYTLVITKLNDTNEGMYSLATQIYISGAGARSDFFVGTTGMGTGNNNFNSPEYAFYTENNNLFTTRVLWKADSTPNSVADYTVTALAAGDVNGDGHKDLLMGQGTSNNLILFTNTLDAFGTWQSASSISRPDGVTNKINWIAFGDVTGDGHDDFAYATAGGTIVIYNTTYGSRGWIYNPTNTPNPIRWTGTISKIALKDITGDGLADLVVLAGGKISIYDLKYSYDAALKSQENAKARFTVSGGTSTIDFDLADVDNDLHPDIVTMDTAAPVAFASGTPGVNVNYYTFGAGNKQILQNGSAYHAVGYNLISGTWSNGTIPNTDTWGDNWIAFRENGTAGGQHYPEASSVKVTMRFQTLSSSPDQLLKIRAKIGDFSGNQQPGEVFYVWYSTDGGIYIPVITVDRTTWTNYSYPLPSSVMGKQIYIQITDSLTLDSGTNQTFIMIDHIGVYTNLFIKFTGESVVPDTSYSAVRAAYIDGPLRLGAPRMEIVYAKTARWDVANWTGGTPNKWVNLTGQPNKDPKDPTMYVRSGNPGAGKTTMMNGIASTLFDASDINGDGYTDILVTNYSNPSGFENSYLGFYMNLYSGSGTFWRFFPVTQWLIAYQGADPKTWIDIVVTSNLNG